MAGVDPSTHRARGTLDWLSFYQRALTVSRTYKVFYTVTTSLTWTSTNQKTCRKACWHQPRFYILMTFIVFELLITGVCSHNLIIWKHIAVIWRESDLFEGTYLVITGYKLVLLVASWTSHWGIAPIRPWCQEPGLTRKPSLYYCSLLSSWPLWDGGCVWSRCHYRLCSLEASRVCFTTRSLPHTAPICSTHPRELVL